MHNILPLEMKIHKPNNYIVLSPTCYTYNEKSIVTILLELCMLQAFIKLVWIAIHKNIIRSDANTLELHYFCIWTATTWFVTMEMWQTMLTHIAQNNN